MNIVLPGETGGGLKCDDAVTFVVTTPEGAKLLRDPDLGAGGGCSAPSKVAKTSPHVLGLAELSLNKATLQLLARPLALDVGLPVPILSELPSVVRDGCALLA